MHYYEVLIASGLYHGQEPLTYSSDIKLAPMTAVTVSLRQRTVAGFIVRETNKPTFEVKPIKSLVSDRALPRHCLALAEWLCDYYACSPSEALRQFAPSRPPIRANKSAGAFEEAVAQLQLDAPLTPEQKQSIKAIKTSPSATVLLHGDTGSGKTRVYLELAKEVLAAGRSVLLLTPEISLTTQLALSAKQFLNSPQFVLHSRLSTAQRKKIWLGILEANEPIVVIGPRSALFSPVANPGLVVLDEAHEPAYKQEQNPRYHSARVASQLANLTGCKVVLGSATPLVSDYYLAQSKKAIVRMHQINKGAHSSADISLVDLRDRSNFSRDAHLSNHLLDDIKTTLSAKKQIIIYLNRRGSARVIVCQKCGWRMTCPNCDIPMVYHADEHFARCHTCGRHEPPPMTCPSCGSSEITYRSVGTKALTDTLSKLFPHARIQRFDSDNGAGEQLEELYSSVVRGDFDILVGTQVLAKGLDLPKLGLVGIVAAETALALPDYTAEERSFQLLYQVIGRVGRGHGKGKVVIQSYDPDSILIQSASKRDWLAFYKYCLDERRDFRFPPFSFLMRLVVKRSSVQKAEVAAEKLQKQLRGLGLKVEVIGPSPSFYGRRGQNYYYQLVVKAKDRSQLLKLARQVPTDWQIDLDPIDLL